MTGAYRTRDQRVADEYLGGFAACSKCRQPTEHSELSTFGAQCRPCFATYCAEANSDAPPPRTPAERRAVLERLKLSAGGISLNHAAERVKALRNLEASGKQLGGAQLWVLACCEQKLGIGPAIAEDAPA